MASVLWLQIVESLRQRVLELEQLILLVQDLAAMGPDGQGGPSPEEMQLLLSLMEGLLPATILYGDCSGNTYASRGGGRGWAAMVAAGGPPRITPATRRQRIAARLVAAFPTVQDDVAAAGWANGA